LCFAFELDDKQALDFLWKVCKLNGFNFRRAEDIIYCYCLANNQCYVYADAVRLIKKYIASPLTVDASSEIYTKSTRSLISIFSDLKGMDEATFLERLQSNKKNFIGYSITAHNEFLRLYSKIEERLTEHLKYDYAFATSHTLKNIQNTPPMSIDYETICSVLVENSSDNRDELKKDKSMGGISKHLKGLLSDFLNAENLKKRYNEPRSATEKEHGSARKVFVFFYFADFVFKWDENKGKEKDITKINYFERFYRGLNSLLQDCGYAYLYPADPFDWLILNCIMALYDGHDAHGLYLDTIDYLIEDEYSVRY
jgi:hypothetical protein